MKRIVLTYGLLSGAVLAVLVAITLPLCLDGSIPSDRSQLLGYSEMVLASLLIFFGIRRYRETIGSGAISFGRAVGVGLLITLVTCTIYVVGWEITYWGFFPDFADTYSARMLEEARESGASPAAIAEQEAELARFRELYRNPLFNVAITFLEVFPVGLIVTLVSAAILRRRPGPEAPAAAAVA